MSSKTQDPPPKGVARADSTQHHYHVSLKTLLVSLCALVASFALLANSRIFQKPRSQIDLIFDEIAPTVTREDLEDATDAVNEVLSQLIVELRAHSPKSSKHPLRQPTKGPKPAKRQLISNLLGGLFGGDDSDDDDDSEGNTDGEAGESSSDGAGGANNLLSGLLGGLGDGGDDDDDDGGGLLSKLAKPLVDAVGNVITQGIEGEGPLGGLLGGITDALGSSANALGAGVGEGTIKGLNLGNMTKLRTASTFKESGIPGLAKDLGMGASEAIFSSLDLSKLTPSEATLALAASALGSGLGNGSASGLKLSQNVSGPDDSQSGISGLLGNLGFGLTDGLFGNIDTASLINGQMSQGFMKTLAQIPGPAGRGLGQGAAIGLKLANSSSASTDTSNDTFDAGIASESFSRELASGFLGNTNIQQVDQEQLLATVAQVAPAIGKGLGKGAAAGLKGQGSASAVSSSLPSASSTAAVQVPANKRQAESPQSTSDSLDFQGIAGDFSQNLAESFVGNVDVSQLGGAEMQKQLLKTLGEAAPFAGSGLGQGAAEGLGLSGKAPSTSADSKRLAVRQASEQEGGDASVGDITQDFTRSLSSTFLSNVNFSSLMSDAAIGGSDMIGPAVQGLGQGLGGGAATGLGLQKDVQETINGQDIGSVLKGFSRSLTTSFLANGTLENIQEMAANSDAIPVVPAVLGLAKGFGNGAATAFGLKEAAVTDPSATDIPTVAQGFSDSLTQSFLSNGTTRKLSDMLGSQGSAMVGSIAEGLGKGFGTGAAVALGLQSDESESESSDSSDSSDSESDDELDIPEIARGFSRSLTTSFLGEGTLDKLTQMATSGSSGLTENVDFSKVAEGLGIGLIDGGSMAIFEQTGSEDTSLTDDSQQFNDTVGGAATGFGRGVSSEAVKAIFSAFGNKDVASKLADTIDSDNDVVKDPSKRSAATVAIARRSPPSKRQTQTTTSSAIATFAQNLNFTTVNGLLEQGTAALGCTGVGGLIQVALGLQQNALGGQTPALPTGAANPLAGVDQTITLTSLPTSLYRFTLALSTLTLTVNGLSITKLAALLAAHVLAVALAFYLLLPAALALGAARTLATDVLQPPRRDRLPWAPRAITVLRALLVPALAATGAGLGAAAAGSSDGDGRAVHARTPHQIVGWVTLAAAVTAAGLHVAAVRALDERKGLRRASEGAAQLVLALAQVELVLGFQDLDELSFCAARALPLPVAVAVGVVVTAVVFLSAGAVGLRVVVTRWAGGRRGEGGGGGGDGGAEKGASGAPVRPLVSRFST